MKDNIVEVKIEITKNSRIKYEYNRLDKQIHVDRILREDFKYPANYGFIPNALDWDGDELDVLLYSEEEFIPGAVLNARIIGAMKMIDSGETDTKLIAVHADDYRLEQIKELKDLPEPFLMNLAVFFNNYKNWKKPNLTKVEGFENIEWALKELNECIDLMDKYGKMPKKEFIAKMMKEHPEKYE
ncbi:Inorganic pyrophosphatase [Mycoplasmopsis meleagridis]|uniref:Inorganic pyrophosphatase n=1 Tax=Mycoplasmopsis meleagridis ATCC 25294 TaxID=1264554 RepID=A0A0F5H1B1_9BACT|nr:inorganic diphosphatase [Mycoplasmopsis meleagridis]KKB26940.1 Inorganic pyrophosphatase [Mycoplasmopsis meleagridis ATCC 25294]OAD18529.1 Inorganic pyrophosphatase [Mycoplasmopsis meleagridis]VEU77602.1 inorganic pyrophosphatase [Mycoplasmopsis meleagridis]